ncbi:DNA-binding MarR family transcriptional regulator [Paenibacillus forsythiae]|uniref:DNA-binding MarR family transcriptional regulator n=1 Tax=Paenibacillus forsythiae TaxID=365616 RepID=A0ABU3HEK3_9BACL|nr:MarR family transcriptional regulator [Paenibacillus forsythiae]MDT3428896.1 DNA-binding MarR family transcriptional regulator [Paenibacillus forsythiae]
MSIKDREDAVSNVMNQMTELQQKSQAFIERIIKPSSLTPNQILLLFQLRLSGSLTITDVAEWFAVTPGAASSMSDKLEDLGLLRRMRASEDRRVVTIVLTEQGEQQIVDLFRDFEASELTKISGTLEKINRLMAEIAE